MTNYDRYLDRTDFSVQNLNRVAEDSFNQVGNSSFVATAGGAQRITGNLFMNGDGVNLAHGAQV